MEQQASWIAEILLAAMLTAVIVFGSRISTKLDRFEDKLDRIEERVSDNGERIARIEGVLSLQTPAAPQPPAPQRYEPQVSTPPQYAPQGSTPQS